METKSNFDAFERRMVQATAAGLAAVKSFLIPQLRAAVGIHNPTHKRVKYTRPSKSGAKTHTIFEHGAPQGGPPWTRTTAGLHAIASETLDDGMRLRIGVRSNAKYMLMLDAGIKYSSGEKKWPWALSTVDANMKTCEQLFMTGAH